jgi:hypothetical protein
MPLHVPSQAASVLLLRLLAWKRVSLVAGAVPPSPEALKLVFVMAGGGEAAGSVTAGGKGGEGGGKGGEGGEAEALAAATFARLAQLPPDYAVSSPAREPGSAGLWLAGLAIQGQYLAGPDSSALPQQPLRVHPLPSRPARGASPPLPLTPLLFPPAIPSTPLLPAAHVRGRGAAAAAAPAGRLLPAAQRAG